MNLKKRILSAKDDELKTSTNDYQYNYNGMKKLIKDITNNKSTKCDVINNVKKISVYASKVRSLRPN